MYSLSYPNSLKGNNDLRAKNEMDRSEAIYTEDDFNRGPLVHDKTVA